MRLPSQIYSYAHSLVCVRAGLNIDRRMWCAMAMRTIDGNRLCIRTRSLKLNENRIEMHIPSYEFHREFGEGGALMTLVAKHMVVLHESAFITSSQPNYAINLK